MSDYIKATNFATKDTLAPGQALKRVQGTEIDTEFNAIATAVGTKADKASPNLTGTPTTPTAIAGTNNTQIASTAFVQTAITDATSGLGTMSTQDADAVAITGGTVTATFTGDLTGDVTGDVTGNADTASAAEVGSVLAGLIVRAWVTFSAPSTILASYNVTSITRNALGDFTITFTNALPSANYAVSAIAQTTVGNAHVSLKAGIAPTTTTVRLYVISGDASTAIDPTRMCVTIFGG